MPGRLLFGADPQLVGQLRELVEGGVHPDERELARHHVEVGLPDVLEDASDPGRGVVPALPRSGSPSRAASSAIEEDRQLAIGLGDLGELHGDGSERP